MRNDIKRFAVAVLAACGLAVSAALAEPSYQARLTVQGYEGAELADFPVLVRLSSQTIKGFDGTECEADGSDLRFVNDAGDVYPHEIDTWVRDGESLVWVKLPQLAKGESFFVQWGGGTVESSNASGTWNNSYAGVWHMGEADGVCRNSTRHGSAYDATPKGATSESVRYDGSDAPVGGARTTAKTNLAYLSVPSTDDLHHDGVFTISGWVRCEAGSRYFRLFSRKKDYTQTGWEAESNSGSMTTFWARGNASAPQVPFELPSPGLLKNWVHLAFVYDATTLSVYGNGKRIALGTINQAHDNGLDISIGCNSNGSEAFVQGAFDECRLMGGAASADWVKAEYDTVSNQGFLAYAEAESLAPDPTLRLTAFRSSAVADTSADFMAYVKGLGEGAASATLTLEYGFDAASLDRTQEVRTIDQAERAEIRLSWLQPGRTYFVRLVVRNNLGESIESDVLRVKTAVVPEGFGEPGLNQTFFTRANANWGKSYAELPPGTDWLNYQDGNRIYRRELGVLAAYVGGTPGASAKKRRSAVWGDEVYWPENSGQWVYWGKMHLEGGKSYLFRTHIDDCERVQVTDPRTGKTTTLLEDVTASGSVITSPKPFEPTETGWYPIEIRMGDNSGGAGGYTTTDDYLNTQNIGWSDDGGKTWNLMMDEGDGSLFMTGDSASVSVQEVVSDGALQRLDLTFPAASGPRDLRVVWGPVHGGNTLAGWSNTNHVATIAAGQTKATYSLPPNWGSADNLVLRFCLLDGARPVWSPSVYWRDVADPAVSLDALDGRQGDKLKVTGDLKDYAGGRSCTLKVLVGPSEDEMTQVWTGPADFVRPSPGAFELTLFESNTSSPKYLAPGEAYFVCIEAEAGGRRTRSQTKRVKMAGAPAFGSVSADVSRRTVTFRGRLTDVGMGDVATVSLWVGETSAEASLLQVETPIAVRDGEFEIVHTFPAFDRDYSWQLRASVTSGGGTATAETCTDVATCHTLDTTTYTWTGAADSDWGNSANWSDGEANGDSCGYPQSSAATVNFPAGTKARIVLSTATSVGTLNLAAAGTEVTFARAAGQEAEDAKPKLSVNNELLLSGARLRLVLDGVALESPGTSLSAFDGEVRLSNGASWNLGALYNDHGGRLLLDRGTSLTCSDYVFGGGLTVIDDATLQVRASLALGHNMPGGKIRFVGTQPAFRCSAKNGLFRSNLATANVRLEFALPVGGYATPPFFHDSDNPDYILGYNGNEKREWPITVDVAPDSPAAFVDETTETTLISWGKGICSNILLTAAQPGADATFVWSEENVSENPVSLGVRVVGSSHSDELHVKGEPESFPCASLSPGYGAVTVARDETRTCTAPADPVNVSETKRVTCVGWKLYSVDAASLTRKLVGEGDGTSCAYTNTDGLWHELVWQWKVEYLVKATTDGNGTAFVKAESVESASPESAWVETGKRVRVTVTPNDGFGFGKWTGDMPADHDKDFELRFTVRDCAYAFEASFLPVVYVSPSGDDDNNDGKSLDTAFKTIGRALQEGPNVYVRLADGTYEVTEQIVIANGSTVAGATPGAKAVVKLMKPLSSAGAEGSVFKLAHADARLYNLTVTTDFDRGDASQNAYGAACNGGFGRGVWIEQAGLVDGCVITNCRSLYCNGSGGGGVYLKKGGIVRRTLLTHNSTWGPNNGYAAKGHNALLDGGGLIESCRLVWGGGGETSETRCGGVYSNGGTVRNSLIACNTQVYDDPASGIAVHLIDGVMENCTVAGNFHLTSRRTPAVYAQNNDNSWTNDPVIRNCVIWGNTGVVGDANWGLEAGRCTVSNTCALPLMPGEGNIAADPCFANPRAGDFRLTLSSAVDAAVPMDWMDWTGDLDGNDRQQGAAPDMGCYEFAPSAFSCGFAVSAGGALGSDDITLTARVAGDDLTGLSYTWTLKDEWGNTIDERTTTETSLTLPLTSGLYTVVLSVKKGEETVGTVTRQDVVRVNQKNFYIATDGADEYPYDTVAKAARDFNTVLSLAVDGAVIHVAPGWYRPADGLTVAKGVTIVADEGPEKTFLFAPMTTEYKAMVTVLHAGAVLSGLTVTGKGKVKDEDENETQPEYWGGLRVTAGVVTNCVISHHKTRKDTVSAGCRLEGGTVVDCTFTNNFCWFVGNAGTYGRGGAVTMEVGDALLDRCTVVSNRIANAQGAVTGDTYAYGGGVYLSVGTVRNSLVVGNESHAYGGGIAVKGTGRVLNCTVVGNAARLGSGGIWQGDGGTVRDCLCLRNVAHGVVDVADDPGFVDAANGDYRLNPASAAVDAADGDGTDLGGLDRAGRPRKSGSAVDKGCYEWEASQTNFGISFRKLTPFAPGEVEFSAKAANGTLSDCRWTFNGREQMIGATVTNSFLAGSVSVSFSAKLDGQPVAVDRPDWFVAYGETVHVVVSNENPVFPYATWETAATNLNDAFAAVQRNGTILMGEGTYLLADERTIDFPMTLRGANGPERTILDAQEKLRPFQLRHPSAVLDGLTLLNGRGGSDKVAAGVAIRGGGQVTNCVFAACCAESNASAGVGVEGCGARILDCRFEGCWVDYFWSLVTRQGVAINASGNEGGEEDLLIDRCLVRGSYETRKACGDGAIRIKNGTVRNTIVTGSILRGCGGIVADGTAKVENCTIIGNVCTNETEQVTGLRIDNTGVKVYNTIAWNNLWTNGVSSVVKNVGGAGGYDSCLENCCTAEDPKLRGYGKFVFRPTSGSPCIDAGSPLPWMDKTAVDVYGRPRMRGKGPDIGAAEALPPGFMIQVR